jgi:hypothetical protein
MARAARSLARFVLCSGPVLEFADMSIRRRLALRPGQDAKLLGAVWGAFFLLVGLGIHGAPMPALARTWAAEPDSSYVLEPVYRFAKEKLDLDSKALERLLLMVAPEVRSDDYLFRFPLALSQLSHNPKFPVVNTNYWDGRNMLPIDDDVPVWHISLLARPGTWGYFLLGAQRGLAWQWWFPVFACFSALYLLLEIFLEGERRLAAFGAFWFCGSAYVVAFGYWESAYLTFFAALAAVACYRLLKSERRAAQLGWGALLGLCICGFVIVLYPAWQLPVGYFFLLILAGLVARDKLYRSLWPLSRWKLLALGIAALVTALIILPFLGSSWDAVKAMAGSIYPGSRRNDGGRSPLWFIFSGFYNLTTTYGGFQLQRLGREVFVNECEASSFYLFFPAPLVLMCLSKRWRDQGRLLDWMLIAYVAFLIAYMAVGLPHGLAWITLMDRTISRRATLGVGLGSIFLCLRGLQWAKRVGQSEAADWERLARAAAAVVVCALCLSSGLLLAHSNHGSPPAQVIVAASLLAGYAAYSLAAGRTRVFCAIVGIALLATTSLYHPLSTNLDYIYKTELAQAIRTLDRQADRPLWVCYERGPSYAGVLVAILGGRTVSGLQWPPPLNFWHAIDPQREFESYYNNYTHLILHYTDDKAVSFSSPAETVTFVTIAPDNPVLKAMGAKYILAMGESARLVDRARFPVIYESRTGTFSIFEIP